MKLNEIIDTQYNDNLRLPARDNPNSKELGDEFTAHAKVQTDPDDSHMAIRQTDPDDPHTDYIDALIESGLMSSNPYFPRVYQRGQTGGFDDIIQMEKLSEFATIKRAELDAVTRKVFGMDVTQLQQNILGRDPNVATVKAVKKQPMYAFTVAVDYVIEGDTTLVKDKKFLQALQFIMKLKRSHSHAYDLHVGNYLIRRGQTGVQLVFADPLIEHEPSY